MTRKKRSEGNGANRYAAISKCGANGVESALDAMTDCPARDAQFFSDRSMGTRIEIVRHQWFAQFVWQFHDRLVHELIDIVPPNRLLGLSGSRERFFPFFTTRFFLALVKGSIGSD
jgi:hypothetical protein